MTVYARPRSRAVSAFVVIVIALAATYGACADVRRQPGDRCIKNEDCLTDICTQQVCATAPTYLDGGLPPTENDSGGSADTSPATDSATGDTGTGADSGDSGGDGG